MGGFAGGEGGDERLGQGLGPEGGREGGESFLNAGVRLVTGSGGGWLERKAEGRDGDIYLELVERCCLGEIASMRHGP